jgi:exodeoxyribonuclease X
MAHVIRVVDFETTGMEPPAEVVEVGYCDLSQAGPGAPWIVDEPVSRLCGVGSIPPEVRAVHWIRHSETVGLPAFDPVEFVEGASGCAAIAAHNMDFENAWLKADGVMPLICTLKAAYRVWPEAPGHSNSVLRCWLEDRGLIALTDQLAEPPHRAGPDAYVTAHILAALLAAGATGKDMVAWTREPRLLPTCPIGKFRGKPWADVEAGFLTWMLNQASMEADLKWNAERELERRRAKAA